MVAHDTVPIVTKLYAILYILPNRLYCRMHELIFKASKRDVTTLQVSKQQSHNWISSSLP